jgi:hypothetical protein
MTRQMLGRLLVAFTLALLAAHAVRGEAVFRLIVDVRTQDKRFAGTDDDVHLQIGGRDFNLDNPSRDDRERGNVDHYEFDLTGQPLSLELIRGIGQISVTKIQDSFFGGGWGFGGLTIRSGTSGAVPLYENDAINRDLDGDDLEFVTNLGDPGWNVPEPPPFPPCTGEVIILSAPAPSRAADTSTLDSDCDGIPDPDDPTFDTPPDSDGDDLPDLYETQTGSDPNDSDSDDDNWADGRNRRSYLVLTRIVCNDENEDAGSDELYLTAEDVRHPASSDLDGYWAMNDGTQRSPGLVIDVRMLPAGTAQSFRTRMRLRESDITIFERPFDDTFETFELSWDDEGETTHAFAGDDADYVLTFRWFTVDAIDPDPVNDSDLDRDGFRDGDEARLSIQDPSVQATDGQGQPVPRIDGFDGLADPAQRELWVEVDASGSEQALIFHAKQMVASRFAYQRITPRIDDGFLGGGQILPHVESWTPADVNAAQDDPTRFSPGRQALGHFRYAFLVEDLENGAGFFGDGTFDCPRCRIVFRGTPILGHTLAFQAQPIFFMHELGHTMGLCHRPGDRGQQVSPCPTPSTWGTANPRCTHYCGVSGDSTTAMGSEGVGDDLVPILGGALTGAGAGIVAGGLIGGTPGAIIGGIVGFIGGGIVGAVLGADFYEREVDYDPIEWQALRL